MPKKEILNDNEKKPKRDPKPTNHLLIPLPCDLKADYRQFENNMEQTYLIQFFEEYLKKQKQYLFWKNILLIIFVEMCSESV